MGDDGGEERMIELRLLKTGFALVVYVGIKHYNNGESERIRKAGIWEKTKQ